MRTGIVICNYNMEEKTDALVEHLVKNVKEDFMLSVVDNGSTITTPSMYTTLHLPENIQMTRGFMAGVDQLDKNGEFDYYWLIITSVDFNEADTRDPVKMLTDVFSEDDKTYAVQPSLNKGEKPSAWKELLSPRDTSAHRRVWSTDYCCTMYRADWFNDLGRWNTNLPRGWGLGAENFYLARKNGWHIYTHDGYVMNHRVAVGYDLDRMGENYEERSREAALEMDAEFIPKYGKNYLEFLNWSHRETGRGEW